MNDFSDKFCRQGAHNWAEIWRQQKQDHLNSLDIGHEGDFWMDSKNVRQYIRNTQGQYSTMVHDQLQSIIIPSGARVLDIGSGPGTLAVPLAMRGCKVTIVEQAPLMCEACEEYRRSVEADPITIINKRWEDVDPRELSGPFDLVICSYALTMIDLVPAIQKMQEVTSGRIYIFWFLTLPSWGKVLSDLWEDLHGKPYLPTPLANCLWNVLYEMNIYASLDVMSPASPHFYDSPEHAAEQYYGRLLCTEEWQKEKVRNYFKNLLCPVHGGKYLLKEGTRNAKIWWGKESGK